MDRRSSRRRTNEKLSEKGALAVGVKNSPDDRNRDQRAEMALQLRIAGYGYADIAKRCGYANASIAWKAIKRLRERTRTDDQRAMMEIQNDRIERALLTVMNAIETWQPRDKLWAVDRLTPLLKRQAELLGLDTPRETAAQAGPIVLELPADAAQALRRQRPALIPMEQSA